jgi:hypothetical protein
MGERPEVGKVISWVAGFGLSQGSLDPDGIDLKGAAWPPILAALQGRRLTGLAVAAADAGMLFLSDEQWAQLLERHRSAMIGAISIERTMIRVVHALETGGIEVVVLKGAALAHTIYPDPSWRPFGDVDLLVHTRDWRRACAVLAELGFRRYLPEPRKGFDERFGKAATHVSEDGIEVDLHRTLVLGPFGLWLDPEQLFESTAPFSLAGRSFNRLGDTHLLLHACMHASLGFRPPLPIPVRDVAEVALRRPVDWAAVDRLASAWRMRAVVQHAFGVASDRLDVRWPPGAELVLTGQADRRERRALAAYTTDRRDRGGMALATLQAVRGSKAKIAFLRSMLLPRGEFLAARAGDRQPSYRRRWATPLRWLRGERQEAAR